MSDHALYSYSYACVLFILIVSQVSKWTVNGESISMLAFQHIKWRTNSTVQCIGY